MTHAKRTRYFPLHANKNSHKIINAGKFLGNYREGSNHKYTHTHIFSSVHSFMRTIHTNNEQFEKNFSQIVSDNKHLGCIKKRDKQTHTHSANKNASENPFT